jgi:hypothetical protein
MGAAADADTPHPPSSPEVKQIRMASENRDHDGDKILDLEKGDRSEDVSPMPSSTPSIQGNEGRTIVSFVDEDPLNPYNWGWRKKLFIVIGMMFMVMNSTIGSSIASGGTTEVARYFNVTNTGRLTRGSSTLS